MQQQSLGNITEHPRIAVSQEEYTRIMRNLRYYQSKWDDVEFMNTNGDMVKRPFNHLPIGRTAAKKIASLVYNEQATITVDETVSGANEYVQSVLLNDRFNKNFERYFESCLALGGLAMRPYVDGDKIKIAFVQAPVFLPMRSNTQDVSSAAIVTKTIKSEGQKNVYYTLIEFHEWKNEEEYTITNELYRSEVKDRVGDRVPLSELYEELDETTTIKGLSRPLFTYLKTAGMNNKDINSPLGLSIFDNAKSTIDFINTTYDEFKWEVKMGQRRVAVPEQTVRTEFNSRNEKVTVTRKFDPNQNVYEKFDTGGLDGSINITDLTTPIRSEDYIKAINEGLSLFEALVALLVLSGGVLVFQGLTKLLHAELDYQAHQKQEEWILFQQQLQVELDRSHFEKVENNHIYLVQDQKPIAIGQSKGDDIRKTDDKGRGYQPMISGVRSSQIWQEGELIHLRLNLEEGLEREYVYHVVPAIQNEKS